VVKNQSAIFSQRSLHARHGIIMPLQHLCVECLINSGSFGYKFKVDDTPDVEKADKL
jgi:hypothetical protein